MSLFTIESLSAVLAIVSSTTLAVAILRQRPLRPFHLCFSAGMLAFAAEAIAALMLAPHGLWKADILFWSWFLGLAMLVTPLLWMVFVVSFLSDGDHHRPSLRSRLILIGTFILALASIVVLARRQTIGVLRIDGAFQAMVFDVIGRAGIVMQLLATVGLLGSLEMSLRLSRGVERWRMKYLVVGLGGIFIARFCILTSLLLFNVMAGLHIATLAATLFVGNVAVAYAASRGIRALGIRPSRQVVFGSAIVGFLGVYLLAVGVLAWLLRRVAVAEPVFWGSLLLFVSGLILAILLLSEDLRWRVKRFIALHFYRTKYDYREQWQSFTARLGALLTVEQSAPQVAQAIVEAVGATDAALYLGAADGRFRCAASVGTIAPLSTIDADAPLLALFRRERRPFVVGSEVVPGPEEIGRYASNFALLVPLMWRDTLTGLLFLGPERMGNSYGYEDLEFLATVGEQAAGVLAVAQLSEKVGQAREFEAFHRLTSFVIHDIKNSVSSLSLLSRNALKNFDDPEFQRDAIRTVSQVVTRMKNLLGKLATPTHGDGVEFEVVDLKAVAAAAVLIGSQASTIQFVKSLESVVVKADADALQRVLENLIANSMDAIRGEGTITIRTYAENDLAVAEVSDTGEGMSEEYLRESLFVPFRSTKPGGWGIGLYEAREIVQKHGGTMSIASRRNEGTTCVVKLPLVNATPPALPGAIDRALGIGGR